MIIGNQNYMVLAAKVLSAQTIEKLTSDSTLKEQGRKILARWATNQPQALQTLEAQGYLTLYTHLINQQWVEKEALLDNPESTLSEMEIMDLAGINMSLPTSL